MTKILIADDDLTSRVALKSIVESMGWTPILASSGKRAWETLQDNPDVEGIITDMMMPDIDGRGLVTMIRADAEVKNIPIIIISGAVGVNDIADLLALGASRFVAKPIRSQEVRGYLQKLVGPRVTPPKVDDLESETFG